MRMKRKRRIIKVEENEVKTFYNRVTVISDDRLDVTELAKAVRKFGTVVSVSSNEKRSIWDD